MKKSLFVVIICLCAMIAVVGGCSSSVQSISIQPKGSTTLEVSAGTSVNGIKSLLECKLSYDNGTQMVISADDYDIEFVDKSYKPYVIEDTVFFIRASYGNIKSEPIRLKVKADSGAQIQLSIDSNIIDSYTEIEDFYEMFSINVKYSNGSYESVAFNPNEFNCSPAYDSYVGDRIVYSVSYTHKNITSSSINIIRSATNPGYTEIVPDMTVFEATSVYKVEDIYKLFSFKLKDGDNRLYSKDISQFEFNWGTKVYKPYHYETEEYTIKVSHRDHTDLAPVSVYVKVYPVTSYRKLEWKNNEVDISGLHTNPTTNYPNEDIYKKYACILSEVPLEVYRAPVVSAQSSPNPLRYSGDLGICADFCESKSKVTTTAKYLETLMKNAKARGYTISFTYYSPLTYVYGTMTVLRVKCNITSPVGTYADVFNFDFDNRQDPRIDLLFEQMTDTATGGKDIWLDITVSRLDLLQ